MKDQATILRHLVERRAEAAAHRQNTGSSSGARTIAVTSGKGGVGKSVIALNLAVALAREGVAVCLLDADLGLGNIDLLCGLNGYWNLSHVLSGARQLDSVLLKGPAGVVIVPGASGLCDVADCPAGTQRALLQQLAEFESAYEFVIIDTGTGIHGAVRQFVAASDVALIVTTTEPTAIADAYATVKTYASCDHLQRLVVVNQADSQEQAQRITGRLARTSRVFLHADVADAGFIPRDRAVPRSVVRRVPYVVDVPQCPASLATRQLGDRLRGLATTTNRPSGGFFHRLWQRLARKAA